MQNSLPSQNSIKNSFHVIKIVTQWDQVDEASLRAYIIRPVHYSQACLVNTSQS